MKSTTSRFCLVTPHFSLWFPCTRETLYSIISRSLFSISFLGSIIDCERAYSAMQKLRRLMRREKIDQQSRLLQIQSLISDDPDGVLSLIFVGMIVILCSFHLCLEYKKVIQKLGFLTFHFWLLELASRRKENIDQSYMVYQTLFLVCLLSFQFIYCVRYKPQILGKMYGLSKELSIVEHWCYDLVPSLKHTIISQIKFIILNSQWFKNQKSSTAMRSVEPQRSRLTFIERVDLVKLKSN